MLRFKTSKHFLWIKDLRKFMLHNIVFKRVNVQQVHLLQKVAKETFIEAFAKDNSPENLNHYLEHAFSISSLTAQINNLDSAFFLVYQQEHCCGYFKINIGESQTEIKGFDGLELERIYLYEKYQGMGLGHRIINEVKIIATQKDKKYIWLGVWEHNLKAIKFYERNGFQKFDTHIYPIGDDPQVDWMMKLEME
jgi:diamine N-acetyltransferase